MARGDNKRVYVLSLSVVVSDPCSAAAFSFIPVDSLEWTTG
jgi:hypothetical protein